MIPMPWVWASIFQWCAHAGAGTVWWQPGGHFVVAALTQAVACALMRTLPAKCCSLSLSDGRPPLNEHKLDVSI